MNDATRRLLQNPPIKGIIRLGFVEIMQCSGWRLDILRIKHEGVPHLQQLCRLRTAARPSGGFPLAIYAHGIRLT